jgi:hypothetical protein
MLLETHRCFGQCLKYGSTTFLGHGPGDVKSRTKGVVGVLLCGEGLGAGKEAQCYKSFGRTGRVLSFRPEYETVESTSPLRTGARQKPLM